MTDQTSDMFELQLTAMAHGGSAIGRHNGRAIFVPFGIPGETVRVRIVDDRGRFANARIIDIVTPAPQRVTPRCAHFGVCGGCQLQHVDYAAQLDLKRQIVIDQLSRIGGFTDVPVHPVIPSPTPWTYRTHATFHATPDGTLGFVATDNQRIVPVDECHIIRPPLLALYRDLALDELNTLDRVRLQVGTDDADVAIGLSTTDDQMPVIEIETPVSVTFLPQDDAPQTMIGNPTVSYTVKGKPFRVRIGGFFQVNLTQAETLVDLVLAGLALQGHEHVLDLYSGVGLFTAFIAERARSVTSVESYIPAVEDADDNLAACTNVDLIEGAVEDVLPDLRQNIHHDFDAAVVDPPRSGLEPHALDALAAVTPPRLIYVSCDLATFARDAKRLAAKGYTLHEVQPLDMFPQTASIELVARFSR